MTDPVIVPIDVPALCRKPHFATKLLNGVQVIMVQDPDATVASAAMNIRVGSNNDPPELPGLAHLCEHMLFLGTTKYPVENEYDAFLSRNGGHANAWTTNSSTNYYFCVNATAFEGALDRFVHFFVEPTFTPSGLEREVRAVHSEDEKNHTNDYWRIDELTRSACDAEHPRFRYGNGNIATLWDEPRARGIDVRAMLLAFYQRFYVAEAATLCVYSSLAPDVALAAVAPILGKMRSDASSVAPGSFFGAARNPLSAERGLGMWYNIKCVSPSRQTLTLRFPLPFSANHRDSKPGGYASHILGHECDNSVLGVLKRLGWAEELSAGISGGESGVFDDDWDFFLVSVQLTKTGCDHLLDIIDVIFQGIAVIRREGAVNDAVFEDSLRTARISFDLAEISDPTSHASQLATFANVCGIKRAWSGQRLTFAPDKDLSFEVLRYLVPENCFYVLAHHALPAGDDAAAIDALQKLAPSFAQVPLTRETLHHKAPYSFARVPGELLQRWSSFGRAEGGAIRADLGLPAPNPFISDELSLVPPGESRLAHEVPGATPYGRLWVKTDDARFKLPKAFIRLQLESAAAYDTPLNRYFARVLSRVMQHLTTEMRYYAELAGIHESAAPASLGPELTITGPSGKLVDCVLRIAQILVSVDSDATGHDLDEIFLINAARTARELAALRAADTYQLAWDVYLSIIHTHRHHFDDVIAASKMPVAIDPAAFRKYLRDEFFAGIRFDIVCSGNITVAEATTLSQSLGELFAKRGTRAASEESLPPVTRVNYLAPTPTLKSSPLVFLQCEPFNPVNGNSCISLNFQLGPRVPRVRNIAVVLGKLLSSPFFTAMRTKECLGYVAYSSVRVAEDLVALTFTIQSADHAPPYLLSRIVAFLEAFETEVVAKLTDSELQTIIAAERATLLNYPKSIDAEGSAIYAFRRHPLGPDVNGTLAEEIAKLTVGDVQGLYRDSIADGGALRRPIAIGIFGRGREGDMLPSKVGETVEFQLPARIDPPASANAGSNDGGAEEEGEDVADADEEGAKHTLTLRAYATPDDHASILLLPISFTPDALIKVRADHRTGGEVLFPTNWRANDGA